MKKLKLLALALFIGTTGLFASETSINDIENPNIEAQIENLLSHTDVSFDTPFVVQIKFTFTSNGKIVVVEVDSKNRDVLNYIRKNLNGKAIKNPGEKDKMYRISLKLQTYKS